MRSLVTRTLVALALLSLAAPALARTPERARVDLVVKDADIRDVMTFLAKEGGVNIVCSPKVKGRVTVHLERVRVIDAIKVIAKVHGLDVSREASNVILLMTRSEAERFRGY